MSATSAATPAPPPTKDPMTPAEMEEASIALAYQLQMEEAGSLQRHSFQGPGEQAVPSSAEEDESLKLAMQLQQQELAMMGASAGNEGDYDEDMRLAMQLSQQQDDEDDQDM
jgi:hypothetical protein